MASIKRDIENRFGLDYKVSGDELMYNCPFCLKLRGKADTNRKLFVNVVKGKYHCFKCGAKGRIGALDRVEYNLYDDVLAYSGKAAASDEKETYLFYIPKVKIMKGSLAYDYCISRGITDEEIDFRNIRQGTGALHGRIVIPNRFLDEANTWTDMYSARTYLSDGFPRYKNPIDCEKKNIVYNIDNIMKGGDIYVVEGVITAICAGREAVAVYGCSPSTSQIKQILDKKPKNIYCVLDNDEAGRQPNCNLAKSFKESSFDGNVFLVYTPKNKDASDLGTAGFLKFVQENKQEYKSRLCGVVASKLNKILINN